jgi:hypothetical protein
MDAFGTRLWASEVTVGQHPSAQSQKLISDGQGGIMITWIQYRVASGSFDILAQRLDPDGSPLWGPDGIIICDAVYNDECPRILKSLTGAIIIWQHVDIAGNQIFAQKVEANGITQWTANGICVFAGPAEEFEHGVASDYAGGAIVTWIAKADNNVYAGRVDSNGNLPWVNPVAMMSTGDFNDVSDAPRKTVEDGVGGAITVWMNNSKEIYVQRISHAGQVLWNHKGVLLCNASGNRECPRLVGGERNVATGAVAYWPDNRNQATTGKDIYMQSVTCQGSLGWLYQPVKRAYGVGGDVRPVNKSAVLSPWLILFIIPVAGAIIIHRWVSGKVRI